MEETVSSKLLHKGKNFSFKTDVVRLANGKETVRDVVDHPGAVAIVAIDDGQMILIRQYRYSTRSEILEIPAGTLEVDEDPYACAVRELQEETGYAASNWSKLLSAYVAPGYSNEIIHIYVAEALTSIGASPEEDESIKVEKYPFEKVLEMIESNEIKDSKTITGVLAYLTTS
ncbi:NUDIX hydrolase [Candidatus Bathyarchaeota archaeon]|jgi:ADP-ribose pyrophosphatase|nr:NUDIX hydrolase [Candidatus Bathyarchaeota archaeon]MBT4320604.1 NUDIX hydrolase [Candidatus Bathyarchaeota archaeon]MBT4423554.1 NUDIX hydrolase [Candidatus Bathyarchaeota archaeon]MBT5642187.1 NUDIX hydrolase [Candidatus Bathyarchaeota archaeon]MBT7188477.1 NUDIX hydrolase [Candidatus Bathyarchaeota archaeon]